MYTLLNTLKLGVDSILIDESDKSVKDSLDGILRLDFMSHFVFRLFENLNVDESDPSRFNLEIMVNRGAVTDPEQIQQVKDHTIPVDMHNYIDISKKLNLEKIDTFLKNLSSLDAAKIQPVPLKTKTKKEKKNEVDGSENLIQSTSAGNNSDQNSPSEIQLQSANT